MSTDVFVYIQCTLPSAGTYGCSLRGRLLDDKLNPEDPANLHLRIKMLAGSNLKHIHYPQHAVMRAETLGPMMCSWDNRGLIVLERAACTKQLVPLLPHLVFLGISRHTCVYAYKRPIALLLNTKRFVY